MNRFIRYWNQNRGKIIMTIAIIAFVIVIIQIFDNLLENTNSSSTSQNKVVDKNKPTESVITGEKVSEEKTEENTRVIKEFVDACNSKDYQKAYLLLSETGKKEFGNKSISANNWI